MHKGGMCNLIFEEDENDALLTMLFASAVPLSGESPPQPKQCPPPTALFTGRVDVLAQMRRFFFGTVSKRHTFVLHGLGGAGKNTNRLSICG